MIDQDATNDVLLGFCHNGTVQTFFMNSVLAAFAEDARRPVRRLVEYHDAMGPYIHDNRARIARYFLEHTDYQWLWLLDNDIRFPSDSLYRLLAAAEQHDVRVLAAAYWNRYAATATYLSWLLFMPEGIKAMQVLPETELPVPITAAGMGCTLIHRDALQAVADMHPNDPWDTFGADICLRFEEGGFLIGRSPDNFSEEAIAGRTPKQADRMGEDVTFCLRALRAGFQVYGLPTLVVDHFKANFLDHPEGRVHVPGLEERLALETNGVR